ncbi:hypothetical protein [Sutterella wadsworthensis]|uniref:hypothetical protein n=1 Tax=Sutterella wadsworthensis TaxID=40545 RepID=UPI00307EA1C4
MPVFLFPDVRQPFSGLYFTSRTTYNAPKNLLTVMKLWLKISQGLAALLLSAAALSLLLFAGALILGLAAAALIAAAGLFLAAPDEAKTGLKNVAAALEKLADRFAESVNDMGQVVLACFGAQQAAPNTAHESGSGENMSSPDNTSNSTRTATDDPSGLHAAQ